MKTIKLFKNCENEIRISEKIREIPYFFLYFSPIKSYKCLKISEIDEFSFEYSEIIEKDEYVIISKDDLFEPTFYTFFDKIINLKEKIRFFLDSYTYLLKAITILNKNKIIYFGINDEKIGFNNKKQPVLKDFTKSFALNEDFSVLERIITSYEPISSTIPPEVHILTFVNEKLRENENISQTNIEDISKDFVVKNHSLQGLSQETIKNYFNSCVSEGLAFSIVNEKKDKVFEKILKFSNTWDNYSLSALFLPIIIKIQEISPFFYSFAQLLFLNMDPNPRKRLSPSQTLEKFHDLFLECGDFSEIKTNNFIRGFSV